MKTGSETAVQGGFNPTGRAKNQKVKQKNRPDGAIMKVPYISAKMVGGSVRFYTDINRMGSQIERLFSGEPGRK